MHMFSTPLIIPCGGWVGEGEQGNQFSPGAAKESLRTAGYCPRLRPGYSYGAQGCQRSGGQKQLTFEAGV